MRKIYLASPHLFGREREYLKDALDTNWVAPLGPYVNKCESMVSEMVGCQTAAVSSGTAALHLAMIEAGVGYGDAVFCSDMTFAASVNPAIYQGAAPIFIDCDKKTRNMDPNALRKAFKRYGTPKLVIVPHLYGCPADFEIFEICRKYGAMVVEDAAEVMGAVYHLPGCDRYAGTICEYGVFSFNGNKIVTGSTGGMVLCHSDKEKDHIIALSTQAKVGDPSIYLHEEIGYNYRMSNITAAILCGQIETLDQKIQMKKKIYDEYVRRLDGFMDCEMLPVPEDRTSNYWMSCLITPDSTGILAASLVDALDRQNIQSRRVWTPLHAQPIFEGAPIVVNQVIPNSVDFFNRALCIPSDTNMTETEQALVIEVIKDTIRSFMEG